MAKFDIEYELKANVTAFKAGVKTAGVDLEKLAQTLKKSQDNIDALFKGRRGVNTYKSFFKDADETAKQLLKTATELNKELNRGSKANSSKIRELKQSIAAGKLQYAADVALGSKRSQQYLFDQSPAGRKAAAEAAAKEALKVAAAQEKAREAAAKTSQNIIAARYALYDMANEARRLALVMGGISAAAVKTAIDYEAAFVHVQRTTETTGTVANQLKKELIDISKTTPISFDSIARIATLGAQMGIAKENISEFSKTVTEFAAVTNTSAENVSSSFGRIAQLTGLTANSYDNLASSILYAGRNSVATEEEILALTTQISASTTQAGFLAKETVGLATALASLRIPPEQARGVILRLFADFDKVMARGGKSIGDLGAVMRMSSEDVKSLWKNDPSKFFTKFVKSLSDVSSAGGNMNVVLQQLGIVETREVNVLQRLSGNYDLLVESQNNASSAFDKNNDLAKQFGMVNETVASKLEKLTHILQAIGDSSVALAPLGIILDGVNGVLTLISNSPILSFVTGLGVVVAAGVAIFLLYKTAIWQATASLFAMKEALKATAVEGGLAGINLAFLSKELKGLAFSESLATKSTAVLTGKIAANTTATRALALAQKAIPWVLIATLVIGVAQSFSQARDNASEFTDELSKIKEESIKITDSAMFQKGNPIDTFLSKFTAPFNGGRTVMNGISQFQQNLQTINTFGFEQNSKKYISDLDKSLSDLVSNGDAESASKIFEEMKKQAKESGYSINELTALFPKYSKSVNDASFSIKNLTDGQLDLTDVTGTTSDEIKNRLTESFISGSQSALDVANGVKDFAQALRNSNGDINAWSDNGSKALSAFNGLVNIFVEQAGNDMYQALQNTASAIHLIEYAGGDASSQVSGLVDRINSLYGLNLNGSTITSLDQLKNKILGLDGIAETTKQAIIGMLTAGKYSKALEKVFDRLKSDLATSQKEVKTFADYASDLAGIFKRAFDLRFGKANALSALNDTIYQINKNLAEAKNNIIELQSTLEQKNINKADLQLQLQVATQFGDTAMMDSLTKQISQIDAEIANTQEELTYNTDLASGSLDINTRAGRDNLAAVQNLITANSDYIQALVDSGAKTGTVTEAINTNKTAFENQLTAMGISKDEIGKYSKAFDDMVQIVKKAPNKVTIKANTNPATLALNEFIAKANKSEATVNLTADYADIQKLLAQAEVERKTYQKAILEKRKSTIEKALKNKYLDADERASLLSELAGIKIKLSTETYADGGYVSGPGTGTSDSIPAMLSNGEFVMKANAVKAYGSQFFNALNQQKPLSFPIPNFGAGLNGGESRIVYLSSADRELLMQVANQPVVLRTSNRIIAESANDGNRELARRGRK